MQNNFLCTQFPWFLFVIAFRISIFLFFNNNEMVYDYTFFIYLKKSASEHTCYLSKKHSIGNCYLIFKCFEEICTVVQVTVYFLFFYHKMIYMHTYFCFTLFWCLLALLLATPRGQTCREIWTMDTHTHTHTERERVGSVWTYSSRSHAT